MTKRRNAGFMIIELLGAILILAITVLSVGAYKVASATQFKKAFLRYKAVNLVMSQIEDLRQLARVNFNDIKLAEGAHPAGDSNLVIPEGITISYSIVDKYDWPEDGTDPSIPPPAGDDDIDYKDITVASSYEGGTEIILRAYVARR